MADYKLQFRNPRTLALLAEMADYESASWKRRATDAGEFSVTTHKDDIPTALLPYLQPGLPEDAVFEVRRDNAFEFGGVVEHPEYDAVSQMWTLAGPDLKGFWLNTRQINPGASEFDEQSGVVAETAMIHYVEDHLTAPSDSDRDVNGELTGIDFTCRGTAGRGNSIDKNARWENLFAVVRELAHRGDLLFDVAFKPYYVGYEFQVSPPVDATADTGTTPVVFSVRRDNVGGAVYVRDRRRIVNACYVLGSGAGASRTVREVEDTASQAADFRREGHLDARQAEADNDKLDMAGNEAIAQSLLDALTARMEPLIIGPSLYRSEWDLGYDVTLDFNTIGVQVDRRIEEVWVTLEGSEKIRVSFGARPMELPRMIAEILRRNEQAQVA